MKNHLKHIFFLIQTIALALFFFSLSRIVFFLYSSSLFPHIKEDGILGAFWHGIRFDLSAVTYLNVILILLLVIPTRKREKKAYQKLLHYLFVFFNGCALFLNLADIPNVEFTGKRMTADIFSFVLEGDDAAHLAGSFIKDYWSIILIFIVLFVALNKSFKTIQKEQFFLHRSKITWGTFPISILVLGLSILAMRGGTQLRPIKNIHASYYGKGKYVPLILNSPFSIMSTLTEKGIQEKNYFKPEIAKSIFSAEQIFKSDSSTHKNVVVLILESFAKEYIGYHNDFEGYTPFLDSLMQHSLVCQNAYANGKKSIEGIPAILSGIPALSDKPYILSQYGAQKGNSIASILSKQNYDCSFYHGGHPGTMGFDAYAEIADFDAYVDLSAYPNIEEDYDGKWGIFDEPFLQFFKNKLDGKEEPFFASFFNLSSHHPYTIPEKYKDLFPKGKLPIHESIGYSDFALREFFKEAKKSSWFKNTLFVITADHTFKSIHPKYQNANGKYAIPLFFYSGSDSIQGNINKVCQQADLLPSIIDYLNIDTSMVSFGNSVWAQEGFAVNYLNNVYQYFQNGYLLQFNGEKSIALYHLENDSLMKHNLVLELPELHLEMENKLKAYIQEYNYRLRNNKMKLDE